MREEAYATVDVGPQSPAHFLFPSRHGIARSGNPRLRPRKLCPGRPVLDGAIELMRRIKTRLAYEIGATTVTTTPPMSFALRRGVCQDFAHIMISGLRGIGLPAAYVSGYLRTVRPPGAARLQGADAMHAWVMLWCGSASRLGRARPDQRHVAAGEHVVLAVGRDYTDVAPIDGVIMVSGGQRVDVSVSVMPLP